MLALFKNMNLGLALLLELAALAAFCVFGFAVGGNWPLRLVLGLGLPIVAIIVWAIWGAPRSRRRLSGVPFLVLQIVFFGAAAAAFYGAGLHLLGIVFALLVLLNTVLAYAWDQKKAA